MTDRILRKRAAETAARKIVQRFGISSACDIQVEKIARSYGVRIAVAPLEGAAGQFARNAHRSMILVPERVTDRALRRWTVAHELGHFGLDHPSRPASTLCAASPARALACVDEPNHEEEADAFADALLMPDRLLRARCEVSPVSLDIPRALAQEFKVSLPRAAVRFVELTSERCAVVRSSRGFVQKAVRSATFTRDIPAGKRVEPCSVAWDYFANGGLDDRAQPVPASTWIKTKREDIEIVEHSAVLPEHRHVLSLLWAPEQAGRRLGMW